MSEANFNITILGDDTDLNKKLAGHLLEEIKSIDPEIDSYRVKTDHSTMDLGTTIGVIAASGSVIALAQGIGDWLRKRKVNIKIDQNGNVIAENLNPNDALFSRPSHGVAF